MQDDTKKTNESEQTDGAADKIEELTPQSISDRDAQSVKGGRRDDESPKESKK